MKFAHFMLDIQADLSRTSCVFQSNKIDGIEVCFSDIEAELLRLQLRLQAYADGERGTQELYFNENFKADDGTFEGMPLEEIEDGEREFQKDRTELIAGYIRYTKQRFDKLVNNPVFKAAKVAFEQREWPVKRAMESESSYMARLDKHGCSEINVLLKHYSEYFTIAEAIDVRKDWIVFKRTMVHLPEFKKLRAPVFWTYVATHYNYPARHELLIRLQLLVSLVPLDTSECERGFSLMNLIMTALRNRLSMVHLDEVMRICCLGPPIKDFMPHVVPIVSRWMEDSKRGRYMDKLLGAELNYFAVNISDFIE